MPWSLVALIVVALIVFVVIAKSAGKGRKQANPERDLLRMVHGDREAAERLIAAEQKRDPSRSRARAAQIAHKKLARDRG